MAEQGVRGIVKKQTLPCTRRDRKLWRAIIADFLREQSFKEVMDFYLLIQQFLLLKHNFYWIPRLE